MENAVESFDAGAFDFIPKPFDIEELSAVTHRGLNYRKRKNNNSQQNAKNELIETLRRSDDPAKYYFLGDHAWTKVEEDGSALIGVGPTFPDLFGPIQRLEFREDDEEIKQGTVCVRFISEQQFIHTLWSPLSGQVIERNEAVKQNASLIHNKPYTESWLVRVIPTNLQGDLENLKSLDDLLKDT